MNPQVVFIYTYVCIKIYITIISKENGMNLRRSGGRSGVGQISGD